MPDGSSSGGWWTSVPGILTGVAAIITAAGGLIAVLHHSPPPADPAASTTAISTPQSRASGAQSVSSETKAEVMQSRYPRTLPAGKEIKVGAGEQTFQLAALQLDRQAEGKLTLRATVKTTCNQSYPCLFSTGQFRLRVDGDLEAPLDGPSEAVPSNSSQKGEFIFAVPEATKSVDFVVLSQQDKYSVPIELTGR